jgi:hypothetical protein
MAMLTLILSSWDEECAFLFYLKTGKMCVVSALVSAATAASIGVRLAFPFRICFALVQAVIQSVGIRSAVELLRSFTTSPHKHTY